MCRASMPKYFFNVKTGQCEKFLYGGCGGNWNRFDTLTECHETCSCKIPPETGHCRGHIRRWFYSPADRCCRPFIYGGCGGNSNNYATWTECSNLCGFPTIDSTFWQWGVDWLKWLLQLNRNQTQTSSQSTSSNAYTRNDFMRDWALWGLLTGGEGELEMEEMASMIAQAYVLGFGQSSGAGASSTSRAQGNYTMADAAAALRYFQRFFGTEAEGRGGFFGGAMGNFGPAYSLARPGSFTPLGEIGSAENYVNLKAALLGAGGLGNADGIAAGVGQWGASQFGRGSQSNQQQASSNNMAMQSTGAHDYGGQGNMEGRMNQWGTGQFGQGFQANQQHVNTGMLSSGAAGPWQGSGGWGSAGSTTGGMNRGGAGQFGQGVGSNQQQANSGNMGMQSAGSAGRFQGMWANSRFQNMGNRREGWAPHRESVLGGRIGFGGAAMELFRLIGKLSSGQLSNSDLKSLAQRYGALLPNGAVDIETLAQRLVGALTGPSGTSQLSQLKGIAQALGTLDSGGNINYNKLMAEIAKSVGRGGPFGLGVLSRWGAGSGASGAGWAGSTRGKGQFGGQVGGQSLGGSVKRKRAAGGKSSKKTYG